MRNRIVTALRTDKGQIRDNNEDAVLEDASIGLLVVADGMGGYNAGEIASQIAAGAVLDRVRERWPTLAKGRVDAASGQRAESLLLREAFQAANTAVHGAAQRDPKYRGMGTTAIAGLLHDDRISIAYVGDSRLYRLRGGRLEPITRDHSLVEELIARGHYSRDEAAQLVRRNIVTRALGVDPEVEVDLIEESLEPGDLVLLCSDGLTDMVDDAAIELTLVQFGGDLDAAAELLIGKANARGGHDNITVALARVDRPASGQTPWWRRLTDWL